MTHDVPRQADWPRWLAVALALVHGAMLPAGAVTVEDRVRQYGPGARERLRPHFTAAGVAYPPPALTMLGIKNQQQLQLYAPDAEGVMRFLHAYPILAASGGPGPKQREGDRQVPEGVYQIDWLHPTSAYHLAMHVNYPNDFDRAQAGREGRTNLGGQIMIHGSNVSIGCLAMGDEAVEELFVLAADTGLSRITLLLVPVDFRMMEFILDEPAWANETLYPRLAARLQSLPLPPVPASAVAEMTGQAATARPRIPTWQFALALAAAALLLLFLLARRRRRARGGASYSRGG